MSLTNQKLVMALPKGRIAEELVPLLTSIGVQPEDAFFDEKARQLQFSTNIPGFTLVRVRSFDVATFVAFGAAQLGVAGKDVLMEFDYPDIYAPLDLGIGRCRLSVAEIAALASNDDLSKASHLRIATKYPDVTRRYFAEKGVQAECIKLNGAMELAPTMGLCHRIVDLVGTGKTLKENGLIEVEKIAEISSHLIVNRTAFKTRMAEIQFWVDKFKEVVNG